MRTSGGRGYSLKDLKCVPHAYLAPLAGRGRIASKDAIRVRGISAHSSATEFAEAAPHPDPLPARAGRGSNSYNVPGNAPPSSRIFWPVM
jgi:hypothetical protein